MHGVVVVVGLVVVVVMVVVPPLVVPPVVVPPVVVPEVVVPPAGVPGVPALELGTFRPDAVLTCQVPPKVLSPSPLATRF